MLGAQLGADAERDACEPKLLLLTVQRFRNKRAEEFESHPGVVLFVLSSCFCAVFGDAAEGMNERVREVHGTETVLMRRLDARAGCSKEVTDPGKKRVRQQDPVAFAEF
jgi:hypothetical protein